MKNIGKLEFANMPDTAFTKDVKLLQIRRIDPMAIRTEVTYMDRRNFQYLEIYEEDVLPLLQALVQSFPGLMDSYTGIS